MKPVAFTKREASVTLDALVHLSGMTANDMREHFGWTKADIEAWSTALRKVDDGLVGR